jgi:hypothetical protein
MRRIAWTVCATVLIAELAGPARAQAIKIVQELAERMVPRLTTQTVEEGASKLTLRESKEAGQLLSRRTV